MSITAKETTVKPFLRWAGGKSWFIETLFQTIEGIDFTDYYEPFLGGGSIFFSLSFEDADVNLSDANKELIDTYIAVRDDPEQVISCFKKYRNTEKFYYQLRDRTPRSFYEKAARFIYLNHTSYNGLYRVNKKGKYNVPYGYRKTVTIDEDAIRQASDSLQNVTLRAEDFDANIQRITRGSLVFLDPPYTVSHNENGFIAYNQKIFSIEDQRRLARYIHAIEERGAYYILTNAAHDAIRDIFKNCGTSTEVERQSLIGGKYAKRGLTKELVFTNIQR